MRKHYDKYAELVGRSCLLHRIPFVKEDVDYALVKFFNLKYLEGEGSHFGDTTMAALMDKQPRFGRGDRPVPVEKLEGVARAVPISLEAC